MENDHHLLPQKVIHHIQYFLNGKEAARTTVLSKSWYSAWSTRPNLDFNQHDFGNRSDLFQQFTKKTMQRYEDLNLNIRSFRLSMDNEWIGKSMKRSYETIYANPYYIHDDPPPLATELIVKAIKLGAINFTIEIPSSLFVLPDELLESQTLARLSVSGFTIDLRRRKLDEVDEFITYPNIRSLNFYKMRVEGDLVNDLISRCPLIEELTVDKKRHDYGPIILREFHTLELRKLKYLCMRNSYIKYTGLSKFACLKELVIWDWDTRIKFYNNLRICSPSLECIRIRLLSNKFWNNVEFDVPNIRMFQYKGSPFSSFEFKAMSCREWESDVQITCPDSRLPASWFSALNKLVRMLSLSRVSLSMNMRLIHLEDESFDCAASTPAAAVENLTLEGDQVTLAFVEKIILSCRPNFINIDEENLQLLQELRCQPWITLLDASMFKKKFVRFQLK